MLVLITGAILALRRRRRVVAAVVLPLIVWPPLSEKAVAHGGEDHGKQPSSAAAAVPGRVVALPKASQFLLGIRTIRVTPQETAETVRLVGRVVPDPAGYARLQPSQPARVVYDSSFPIPVPGQSGETGTGAGRP